ncbi:alpha/beta fold hydrolase [Thorsellia kenyensis]|uniref:Alpha/beta fold hydrolase n=1 Tax=Thorsellia kenyensis TaxID=1549888 RepID=A0ABV6C9U1_9GAMM
MKKSFKQKLFSLWSKKQEPNDDEKFKRFIFDGCLTEDFSFEGENSKELPFKSQLQDISSSTLLDDKALFFECKAEPLALPKGVHRFTLRVEGLDIEGLQAGDVTKPVLVLLHGQYSDAHTWLEQLGSSDLQTHYHMLAWSAPGYGSSEPWPHSNPSGLNFALMLKAWLQQQDKEHIILVGHGLGALVASSYSARFVHEVDGLILVAPELGVLQSGRYRRQTSHLDTNILMTFGKEAFCREKLNYLMVPRFSVMDTEALRQQCITFNLPNETKFVSKLNDEEWQCCAKNIANQLLMLNPEAFEVTAWTILNEDLESYRRYYHGYSEVWAAEFDRMVKQHDARRLASRYQSTYQLFQGVGHFFHIEDPKCFNDALVQLHQRMNEFQLKQLNSRFNQM